MPRSITTAPKIPWDFHKSDELAQPNQIKYDCFFLRGTENIKKKFSISKIRNKHPGHVFLDFALFFNIAMEKFG